MHMIKIWKKIISGKYIDAAEMRMYTIIYIHVLVEFEILNHVTKWQEEEKE